MKNLPWNRGQAALLWTPTRGQDVTNSLFPLTPERRRRRCWLARWCAALVLVLALASSARAACTHNTPPAPDTRTGIGFIDYQLCHWETVFNAMVSKLWSYFGVAPISVTIPAPVAGDDGVPMPWVALTATTLQRVSCRVEGACATPPTYTLETDTGVSMTLAGGLVCARGATAASAVAITSGGSVAAGHGFHFSTSNTPTPDCTFAVLSVVAAESMP